MLANDKNSSATEEMKNIGTYDIITRWVIPSKDNKK